MSMRFGVHGLNFGQVAGAVPTLLRVVTRAEELGFDSVWVGDHIIIPWQIASAYPYSPTGTPPFKPEESALEPLTLLSYLAGCTSRVQLGISVLIVPHRNPLYTAKVLSTLDVLSGGRVICGVGSGWMREEFEALGLSFERRGAETLEVTFLRPMQILDRPADGPRRALIGTAEQVAEDIRAYERVGVSHLVLGFRTTVGQEMLQQVE